MNAPTIATLDNLDHEKLMGRAIELAASARKKGNKPFAALLADVNGNILLEAENTEFTENDFIRHSEINLMSAASRRFHTRELAELIMYVSAEPCAMCAGATFFAGVRTVVFGLSADSLANLWAVENPNPHVLDMSCRQVFESSATNPILVLGPIMEDEASVPHMGYVIPDK
ncbi:MAG: nucleoside deaminase [Albidovulum sp.]|nr:nucleoside deaminase [Albidovulum sp.]MDE0532727.1 nucleoside deaminase [Albidovulum sp.]